MRQPTLNVNIQYGHWSGDNIYVWCGPTLTQESGQAAS